MKLVIVQDYSSYSHVMKGFWNHVCSIFSKLFYNSINLLHLTLNVHGDSFSQLSGMVLFRRNSQFDKQFKPIIKLLLLPVKKKFVFESISGLHLSEGIPCN